MDHPDHPDGAPGPSRTRAIRRRVLERIADGETTHLTIDAGDGQWQPFLDGIRIKILHERDGVLSYLLEFEPGASLPPHRHPVDEECVVLQGRLRVGTKHQVGPGGYHLARQGALHATVSTETGALIFLRGAVPDAGQMLG